MTEPLDPAGAEAPPPATDTRDGIPHVRVVVCVTFFILLSFAAVTIYVLATTDDATIRGAIIGTWTALATSAGGFWLGASSGGKLRK